MLRCLYRLDAAHALGYCCRRQPLKLCARQVAARAKSILCQLRRPTDRRSTLAGAPSLALCRLPAAAQPDCARPVGPRRGAGNTYCCAPGLGVTVQSDRATAGERGRARRHTVDRSSSGSARSLGPAGRSFGPTRPGSFSNVRPDRGRRCPRRNAAVLRWFTTRLLGAESWYTPAAARDATLLAKAEADGVRSGVEHTHAHDMFAAMKWILAAAAAATFARRAARGASYARLRAICRLRHPSFFSVVQFSSIPTVSGVKTRPCDARQSILLLQRSHAAGACETEAVAAATRASNVE